MKLADRSVLHVVDKATKFGAAQLLSGESVDNVWAKLDVMWIQTYIGPLDVIATDSCSAFTSREWHTLLRAHGIRAQVAGVEGHNALGESERYHAFLKRIFHKARTDSQILSDEYALALLLKAVNDTAGPNGPVPTMLPSGVLPRLPFSPLPHPGNIHRMESLRTARAEMARTVADERIRQSLRSSVPPAADADLRMGDLILLFREKPLGR